MFTILLLELLSHFLRKSLYISGSPPVRDIEWWAPLFSLICFTILNSLSTENSFGGKVVSTSRNLHAILQSANFTKICFVPINGPSPWTEENISNMPAFNMFSSISCKRVFEPRALKTLSSYKAGIAAAAGRILPFVAGPRVFIRNLEVGSRLYDLGLCLQYKRRLY